MYCFIVIQIDFTKCYYNCENINLLLKYYYLFYLFINSFLKVFVILRTQKS